MSTVIGITTNERYYTIIGANFPAENAASFKLGWAVHETPGIYNIKLKNKWVKWWFIQKQD